MANNEPQLSLFKRGLNWSLPSLLSDEHAPDMLLYDRSFVVAIVGLICFGFVMVMSASMPEATKLTGDPFYFMYRHVLYL
ncbi:MAG: cell division protein FtsW, partial [Shewanella psychromarinicola]